MTAIYGAGMVGRALSRMLGGDVEFIDAKLDNIDDILSRGPEKVILGVLDSERQGQMRDNLKTHGFEGEILTYPSIFDARIATMRLICEDLVDGAVAELGVYKGDFAYEISRALPGREMHLFDSFEGFDGMFTDTSAEAVQRRLPDAIIHKGYFPSTFVNGSYAFISLDADLYEPTKSGLELFYPCLNKGGVIMVHDYNSTQFPGVKSAVDEFCSENGISFVPLSDIHGTIVIRK